MTLPIRSLDRPVNKIPWACAFRALHINLLFDNPRLGQALKQMMSQRRSQRVVSLCCRPEPVMAIQMAPSPCQPKSSTGARLLSLCIALAIVIRLRQEVKKQIRTTFLQTSLQICVPRKR